MSTVIAPAGAIAVETFRVADGCLAYLVVDEPSRAAMVIDPRLEQVDRYVEALTARDARLVYVVDTHTHADHLSGARRLADRTGATLVAHAASKLKGTARRVQGGSALELGGTRVDVLDAPGHTPDSMALLIEGHLFTGDALFVGGAGRTDFQGGSASDLFDTMRAFERLPDATVVHPGHDYVGRAVSTIGEERAQNSLLGERDRAAFVSRLAVKLPPPANMAAILRHNLGEAAAATLTAMDLDAARREPAPPLLLDVRSPIEFEGERIDGSLNIPLDELDARMAEVPEGADVVVVCRTGVRATIAAQSLARSGLRSRVLDGGMHAWRRAGLPVREGRKRLPVDRQVQLIAGLSVLTGVALGAFLNPWFLALAALFGAGLTFAGATGTCGLALVLLKMPWNRPVAGSAPAGAVCAAPGATAPTCAAPGGTTPSCAAPVEPRR
jgi:glyoxylase-like metal-dependent hydrolase (beta-lactamase superfamily II)